MCDPMHRTILFVLAGAWTSNSLFGEISKFDALGYICYLIGKTGLLLVTGCWNDQMNVLQNNLLCVLSQDRQLAENIHRLTLNDSALTNFP
jgi:hypothetical protein